jgi:hypothetical protein
VSATKFNNQPLHAFFGGLSKKILNVGNVKIFGSNPVYTICVVATCKVRSLKSISIFVVGFMKLKDLLFAGNCEFLATMLVGVGIVEHQ